jgi:hypothetical protein
MIFPLPLNPQINDHIYELSPIAMQRLQIEPFRKLGINLLHYCLPNLYVLTIVCVTLGLGFLHVYIVYIEQYNHPRFFYMSVYRAI